MYIVKRYFQVTIYSLPRGTFLLCFSTLYSFFYRTPPTHASCVVRCTSVSTVWSGLSTSWNATSSYTTYVLCLLSLMTEGHDCCIQLLYIYVDRAESKKFVEGTVNHQSPYMARLPDVLNLMEESKRGRNIFMYSSRKKIVGGFLKINSPEI